MYRCVRVRIVEQDGIAVGELSANNIAMRMSSPTVAYALLQPNLLMKEADWNQHLATPFNTDPSAFVVSAGCCQGEKPTLPLYSTGVRPA